MNPPPLLALVEVIPLVLLTGGVTIAYLIARCHAAHTVLDPVAERQRLTAYIAWLEERTRHAVAHDYDDAMKAQIADELVRARAQLAALAAPLD